MTKPKYGPYELMIRYDPTERKLIFVVNGEKNVWDIAELDAKASQPHTADLGTRYRYRQEGAEAERERIIKLLHEKAAVNWIEALEYPYYADELEALIRGEQK